MHNAACPQEEAMGSCTPEKPMYCLCRQCLCRQSSHTEGDVVGA